MQGAQDLGELRRAELGCSPCAVGQRCQPDLLTHCLSCHSAIRRPIRRRTSTPSSTPNTLCTPQTLHPQTVPDPPDIIVCRPHMCGIVLCLP